MKVRSKVRKARKKNRGQSESSNEGLQLLVSLLNAESLAEFRGKTYEDSKDGPWHPLGFDDRWTKKAWGMRRGILDDLTPLIEGKSRSRVENHLKAFLKKINGMNFKPYWDVWPPRKVLWVINRETRVQNPAYIRLGPGQAVLKLGRFRGIVTMTFDILGDPKRYFYGTIAMSLQGGQLSRFKRCRWERCRKFFIAYDGRRNAYCSGDCAKASDRSDAKERVRKSREGL